MIKLKDILSEASGKHIDATYIERSGKLYKITINDRKVSAMDIQNSYPFDIPIKYDDRKLLQITKQFKKLGITFTYDDSMDI